ncbi:response regulator transcription factor [Maledivibacter halophilus]|uniref:Stage 0 sporulation protein A homolog n=1 Tax=Maledivibacter halophilus TaxID=36842 RepID=A0A1T5KQY7_9FIRM|nr:response regulator [Maledivibacter halophilus]SKC66184.1 two-component system, response regulator YesN [Maledivibacter halophilus]
MYSIMIVDDEPIIRKGIANFIQWDSMNCKVTCEATNGLEAKELIETDKPDIIISDIKMPGMDGIDLSKYIHENFPHIKVIILTGYSDFEYAQSAIRYNVVDFVLKPSSNNKITQAIETAIKIISEERLKSQKLESMKDKLNENLSLLQEKFLYDFINGLHQNQTTIQNTIKDLNISLKTYHVLYFKFTTNTDSELIDIKENKKNILGEIKKFVSIIFKDFTHYNITIDCNSICTIINVEKNIDEDSTTFFLNKSKELLDFFSNFMNISISLGISNLHKNLEQVHTAYKEATESLSLRFYEDNNIFTYSDYAPTTSKLDKTLKHNYVDKIIDSIKSSNRDIALSTMNKFIYELKSSRQPIEYIKNIGILISSLSFKLLLNHYINLSEIVENSSKTYTNILNCDSISDLTNILEKVILSSIDRLSYLNSQDNYIIKKVTRYIELNYDNQIKLNDLAELAHVNSSYLSRLIKQETGSTLTEIIAKTRIEKAKDLLSLGNMKTYEIAIKVGIEDPAYFSQVFKKYTGLSPSEFKKIDKLPSSLSNR